MKRFGTYYNVRTSKLQVDFCKFFINLMRSSEKYTVDGTAGGVYNIKKKPPSVGRVAPAHHKPGLITAAGASPRPTAGIMYVGEAISLPQRNCETPTTGRRGRRPLRDLRELQAALRRAGRPTGAQSIDSYVVGRGLAPAAPSIRRGKFCKGIQGIRIATSLKLLAMTRKS